MFMEVDRKGIHLGIEDEEGRQVILKDIPENPLIFSTRTHLEAVDAAVIASPPRIADGKLHT